MITWYVAMAGSDQMAIQRYLATRDVRSARKALAYAWGVEAFAFALMAMIGLALLAWFTVHPEWLPPGASILETPDQLFPLFITYGLPPGISGLVVAGLLAAAMSSLSSGVNSTAAVVTSDFVEGAYGFKLSDNGRLSVARWTSAVVGGVVVVLSAAVGLLDLNLYELTVRVANLMTAPLFVVFCVAFFMPRATATAAWIGAISAAAIAITVSFFEHVHGLGFLWITPLSLAGGVLLALITLQIRPAPIAIRDTTDLRLRTSAE
jgi:solute:Na+ symporter, SSS family